MILGAGEGNRTLATGLEGQGSTTELHPQVLCYCLNKNGGGGRIRTFEVTDSGFTVRPLWPLGNPTRYGANNGTRTRNLLITSQLLYQLSYVGMF